MAQGKSTHLSNAVLNAVLTNVSLAVAATYISLHTGDPAATGANEVASSNAYARTAATWGSASAGTSVTTADVDFPTPTPSAWGTVTYAGVWDAASGGNFLYPIPLTTSLVTAAGIPPVFVAGSLSITETVAT